MLKLNQDKLVWKLPSPLTINHSYALGLYHLNLAGQWQIALLRVLRFLELLFATAMVGSRYCHTYVFLRNHS